MKNYERLGAGLAIFRDTMRPYIVAKLKTEFPHNDWLEQGVYPYLRESQAQSLRLAIEGTLADAVLGAAKSAEAHIDIQHFPSVVRGNWEQLFSAIRDRGFIQGCFAEAARARNEWAHPSSEDLPTADVNRYLDSCTRILAIVDSKASGQVAALRDVQPPKEEESKAGSANAGNGRPSTFNSSVSSDSAPEVGGPSNIPTPLALETRAAGNIETNGNELGDEPAFPEAFALWQNFRNYLKLQVTCEPPEDSSRSHEAQVHLAITNTSPTMSGWPDIVFENISVDIQMPGQGSRSQAARTLKGGETATITAKCDVRQLPALKFQVNAALSLTSFFSFKESRSAPVVVTKPLVLPYFIEFNRLQIHSAVDTTLVSVKMPTAETTFPQLQSTVSTLNGVVSWVTDTEDKLKEINSSSLGESFSKHTKAAYRYLEHIKSVAVGLREAFASTDVNTIREALFIAESLFEERNAINRQTEELMQTFEVADSEVGYVYRMG